MTTLLAEVLGEVEMRRIFGALRLDSSSSMAMKAITAA